MAKPANIFWTGGWDSTFRLLQLIITEKKSVQPYFIVKPWPAVGHEVKVMIDIRRQIFRRYPNTKKLLKPTRYIDILEIDEDKEINKCLTKINKTHYLANQYQFLARFCKQNSIFDMELSIESYRNYDNKVFNFIADNLYIYNEEKYKIEQKKYVSDFNNQICELFKYFKFPVIHLTKKEMKNYSQNHGFEEILNMTWFCATPFRGKPCGFCGPCTTAIKMGLSNRIPISRRLLSQAHMPLRNFYRKKFKNY